MSHLVGGKTTEDSAPPRMDGRSVDVVDAAGRFVPVPAGTGSSIRASVVYYRDNDLARKGIADATIYAHIVVLLSRRMATFRSDRYGQLS